MATSFYGLKSPEECSRRGERGRGHAVETLGKAKSRLWDKERKNLRRSKNPLLWEGSEVRE